MLVNARQQPPGVALPFQAGTATETCFFFQDTRVCPYCGILNNTSIGLKFHIAQDHRDQYRRDGPDKVACKIFWRNKRSSRRMSESQLTEELTRFYVPKEWQVTVKAFATSVLRLAGCSVSDDTVKYESGAFT